MADGGSKDGGQKKDTRDLKGDFNEFGNSAKKVVDDLSKEAEDIIEKAIKEIRKKGSEQNIDTSAVVGDLKKTGKNILGEIELLGKNLDGHWQNRKKGQGGQGGQEPGKSEKR